MMLLVIIANIQYLRKLRRGKKFLTDVGKPLPARLPRLLHRNKK